MLIWVVFPAAQAVLCAYLIARLVPRQPRRLRVAVTVAIVLPFLVFNLPWILWGLQYAGLSPWRLARQSWALPFLAWQFLSVVYLFGVGGRLVAGVVAAAARRLPRRSGRAPGESTGRGILAAPPLSRREFVRRSLWVGGYAATGAGVITLSVGEARSMPKVREVELAFDDLPEAFHGYRILQLTDIHAGINMGVDQMVAVAELARRMEADLIAVTGDLIDWNPRDVDPYVRAFSRLRAPDGVVCVLGNHDYYTGVAEVIAGIERAGHTLLRNEHRAIERPGSRLVVAGIDDPRRYGIRFTERDAQRLDLRSALRGAPAGVFRILLAHRPDAFVGAAEEGIPLTLAGHTHGGQIALFGWSLARLATPFDRGHFTLAGSRLYVCPGVGVVGLPLRLGVPPEIALVRLKRRGAPGGARVERPNS